MSDDSAVEAHASSDDTESVAGDRISVGTLARFLVGDRDAIRQVVRCEGAVWLGLLFVLSAGFAREYDGEYLLSEPWHLLIPLAASIVSSAILFRLVLLYVERDSLSATTVWGGYRTFLSLYWLTAPLAWLYAVPVERFLSARDSVRANLMLLGIVAAWRVVLMIRILSVLYAPSVRAAAVVVLFFADALMLIVLCLTPIPVIKTMGGVRLTEGESLIHGTAVSLRVIGAPLLLILLIGLPVIARTRWQLPQPSEPRRMTITTGLWGLAAASLLMWMPILPCAQREQSLRWQVESALANGDIERGLTIMSVHDRSDFPPHWDPPPHTAYAHNSARSLLDVMVHLPRAAPAGWVNEVYTEKLMRQWRGHGFGRYWSTIEDAEASLFVEVIEQLPPVVRNELLSSLDSPYSNEADSPVKRELTERLIELMPSQTDDPP